MQIVLKAKILLRTNCFHLKPDQPIYSLTERENLWHISFSLINQFVLLSNESGVGGFLVFFSYLKSFIYSELIWMRINLNNYQELNQSAAEVIAPTCAKCDSNRFSISKFRESGDKIRSNYLPLILTYSKIMIIFKFNDFIRNSLAQSSCIPRTNRID